MIKDIEFPRVEGLSIAIVRKINELQAIEWYAYLLNTTNEILENILIASRGYGVVNDIQQNTSVLRHHIEKLEGKEYALIELIDPQIFHLNNEFWVSYFVNNKMFDKKFVFVPDIIIESNLTNIPILNEKGILHN